MVMCIRKSLHSGLMLTLMLDPQQLGPNFLHCNFQCQIYMNKTTTPKKRKFSNHIHHSQSTTAVEYADDRSEAAEPRSTAVDACEAGGARG